MTSISTIQSGDLISNSRTDINNNFANLNSDKVETSYLDTDNTLSANSDSKIATQKAVKAYVDAGGNVNASETAKGIVEEASDAEVLAGTAIGATGAKLFITPAKLKSAGIVKFGGTGATGAGTYDGSTVVNGVTPSSAIYTIDVGAVKVYILNFTTLSITGTAKILFTNPHANGTKIILKSQGAVTITSATVPAIDCRAMGAIYGTAINAARGAGGATAGAGGGSLINVGTTTGSSQGGNDGTASLGYIADMGSAGGGGGNSGTAGTAYNANISLQTGVYQKLVVLMPGAGGGGGGGNTNDGGAGGRGGRGGGALYIECAGAFSCSSTISVAGENGQQAVPGASYYAGNGGGGGGGTLIILYNTLTSDTGTYTVTGGTGGSAGTRIIVGGAGGDGVALRAVNTEFL